MNNLDRIAEIIQERNLGEYELFIVEQSGGVLEIAKLLCNEIQIVDSERAHPFVFAHAIEQVKNKLRDHWRAFLAKEADAKKRDTQLRSDAIQRLQFSLYLRELWSDNVIHKVTVPLLKKLIFDENESRRRSTLAIKVETIRTKPAVGNQSLTIILERFVLKSPHQSLHVVGDIEENLVCLIDDFSAEVENWQYKAKEDFNDLEKQLSEASSGLKNLSETLLTPQGQFVNWLRKTLALKGNSEHYCVVFFEFDSSLITVRTALNIPFEFILLPDCLDQTLSDCFSTEKRFLFLDGNAGLTFARRFRPRKRGSGYSSPLSLSDLTFKGTQLPKVKGHIIVLAVENEEFTKKMVEQANHFKNIWDNNRTVEDPIYESLGEMKIKVISQKDELPKYLRDDVNGLDDTNWHLLHIIGHSEPEEGEPWLIIGKEQRLSPLDITDALEKKPVKAVFFQFCESAFSSSPKDRSEDPPRGFLERCVEQAFIPTILGFRWIVDVKSSGELLKRMYGNWLTGQLELPIALHIAKTEMRSEMRSKAKTERRDKEDWHPNAWLSPVLVYQDFETEIPEQ